MNSGTAHTCAGPGTYPRAPNLKTRLQGIRKGFILQRTSPRSSEECTVCSMPVYPEERHAGLATDIVHSKISHCMQPIRFRLHVFLEGLEMWCNGALLLSASSSGGHAAGV